MTTALTINKTVIINAPASKVWGVLTTPELIREWLSETGINAISDWKVGSPIAFTGTWHGRPFNDKGVILKFEKDKTFKYSYWSHMPKLPDIPENYSIIEFKLTEKEDQTMLTLTQSHFVGEASYEHFNFYWTVTLDVIRKLAEK